MACSPVASTGRNLSLRIRRIVRKRRASIRSESCESGHQRKTGDRVNSITSDSYDARRFLDFVAQALCGQWQRISLEDQQCDEQDAVPRSPEDGLEINQLVLHLSVESKTYHLVSKTEGRNSRTELRKCAGERISHARRSVYNIVRPQKNAQESSQEEQNSEQDRSAVRILPKGFLVDSHVVEFRVFDGLAIAGFRSQEVKHPEDIRCSENDLALARARSKACSYIVVRRRRKGDGPQLRALACIF